MAVEAATPRSLILVFLFMYYFFILLRYDIYINFGLIGRFVLSMLIADHSGNSWVTAFDDCAKVI